MNKIKAKALVNLRGMDDGYTRVQCFILTKLIEATRVTTAKWQDFDIETGRCSSTIEKLAQRSFCTEKTVRNAIAKFVAKGHLIVHAGEGAYGRNQYTVTIKSMKNAPTKPDKAPSTEKRKAYFRERRRRKKEGTWVPRQTNQITESLRPGV